MVNIKSAQDIESFPAEFETKESYRTKKSFYEDNNYSFIPILNSGRYYNLEHDHLAKISENQILSHRASIKQVIEILKDYPFIIVNHDNSEYVVHEGSYIGRFNSFSPPNSGSPHTFIERHDGEYGSLEDFKDYVDDFSQHSPPKNLQNKESQVPKHYTGVLAGEIPENVKFDALELIQDEPEIAQKLVSGSDPENNAFGIITAADVNKRDIKELLYPLIAEIAQNLSEKVKNRYRDSEELVEQANPDTVGYWKKNKERGLEIHISEYLNLVEMKEILKSADDELLEECGFNSNNKVDEKLGSINQLRNKVMHANRTLIQERSDIEKLLKRIELAEDIIENLTGNTVDALSSNYDKNLRESVERIM